MSKLKLIAVIIVSFAMGASMIMTFSRNDKDTTETSSSSDFPLLAQRIFVENPNDTKINFSPLRSDLRNYFSSNSIDGSLYFEYLPTGTSIRINASEPYTAASLMKLPVAMELYRAEELGLLDTSHTVQLKEEWLNDGFGTLYKKGVGYELTLEEAVSILLKESDNTALRVVLSATDSVMPIEERALGSLDIEFELDESGSIDVGTRSYSSFLKCLYFACYNNVENSQHILDLLTQTDFKDRIVAGLPSDIPVAHKIGVFNTNVQSDCGIIYAPQSPYILCLMITGDKNSTDAHFSAISREIHEYLSN